MGDKIKADRVGTIKMTVRFKMGMDDTHLQWLKNNDQRETYESWLCTVAEGYRTRVVKRETPDTVKQLIKEGKVTAAGTSMNGDTISEFGTIKGRSSIDTKARSEESDAEEVSNYHETSTDEQWAGF